MMAIDLFLSYLMMDIALHLHRLIHIRCLVRNNVIFDVTPEYFEEHIARARTIGFVKELEQLQAMGLAKGGSTDNALVYDDTTCLSVPRFEDELVRHKALM